MSAASYTDELLEHVDPVDESTVGTPIYDSVARETGFSLDDLGPTPTTEDLVAYSYIAYDRRHARTRRRDEHGRFLPSTRALTSRPEDDDADDTDDDADGQIGLEDDCDAETGESAT